MLGALTTVLATTRLPAAVKNFEDRAEAPGTGVVSRVDE
jgi:hypothetical protein